MKNWTINFMIQTSIAILKCISRSVRQRIIFAVATCILKVARKTRLRAIKNITNAMPAMDIEHIENLVYQSYQNIVFGVTECFWLDDIEFEIECTEDTLRLLHNPKGCSICTMHMSCIEVAPYAIQKLVGEVTTLSKIPNFLKGAHDVYSRSNINVIDKADPDRFFKLLGASRNGASVCLHGDHYAKEVDVTFFGQPTQAPTGAAMLSAYSKVPLLLCYAILQDDGRYKVFLETIIESHVDNTKLDIAHTVEKIYVLYERVIALHPEQWCWSYNRWRSIKK